VVFEVIPARFFIIRFLCPIAPGFTHRERLWPGSAVKKMLCGIIKNNLRRNYE
jgi:hypothetical protein